MGNKEYIERGALLKRFAELHDGGNWLVNDYNADWIHSFIETAPAADVVEVRHGEWIEHDDDWCGAYYTCSACGCDWTTIDGTPQENNMKYCPECGAKMDGGKEQT